jgi:glycosyltransferase involved in cell wall biosynthesis
VSKAQDSSRSAGQGTKSRISLTKLFEKKVYESATLVIAQSEWTANSLRTDYGVADDRIRIIPFGINVHDALPRVSNALPQITFIGTRLSRKGGNRLLDIWRRYLSAETTLTLVTRDDVKPQEGLRVFQDFRPGDPRLETLFAATDLFVFPSEMDTFGYALIEAMAGEVPTISLDVAARAEIAIDGVTGLVLPESADDGALLAAIRQMLNDPVKSREMGLAGRNRVLEKFDALFEAG